MQLKSSHTYAIVAKCLHTLVVVNRCGRFNAAFEDTRCRTLKKLRWLLVPGTAKMKTSAQLHFGQMTLRTSDL